jgi:pilus assembly protein Flp/PilA
MEAAFMKAVREFWWDQSGATSIEYSIMASCIAVAVVVAVNALGSAVKGNYKSVSTALNK